MKKVITITLTDDELAEAIHIGEQREAINNANGIGHNRNFHKRNAYLEKVFGEHPGSYMHQKGAIGEQAITKYFNRISQHFHLPLVDRTGWGAWTPAQRKANAGGPDLRWLGVDVEAKTAEKFDTFGVRRKDVQAGHTVFVAVTELTNPYAFRDNGMKWTNTVLLMGAVDLSLYGPVENWESLEAPWYDKTNGADARRIKFDQLTPAPIWARTQVGIYQNRNPLAA